MINRPSGADLRALLDKLLPGATLAERADLLMCSKSSLDTAEHLETLTPCWYLVYISLKEAGLLSILWQLKKQRDNR